MRQQLTRSRCITPWRASTPWPCAGSVRGLHKGHVGSTLEKLGLPRHHWLKEVEQAPERSTIRRHKDKYLRELGVVHEQVQGLFKDDNLAQSAVKPISVEEQRKQEDSLQRREDANEALRIYRLLRPEAPPFYEEDAAQSLKAKANRTLQGETSPEASLVPQGRQAAEPFGKGYLPAVNQRAFLLALESLAASLAEDVETLCLLAGLEPEDLPEAEDPLRFKHLLDRLFGAFPLRKDPSRVHEFMEHSWPRLRGLLPRELAQLPEEAVAEWLRGHLQRVRANQRRAAPKIFLHQGRDMAEEEFYSFAEDFPYDDDPLPGLLADERNLDFPLEEAASYMQALLGALGQSPVAAAFSGAAAAEDDEAADDVATQFQDLVWDLERVGLRNWLRMDMKDLERFIPKGKLAELTVGYTSREGALPLSSEDIDAAKLMLRCASRDRANLLDFEAVDPQRLLHGLPGREIDEELAALPPHRHVDDGELVALVDAHTARLKGRGNSQETDPQWLSQGATIHELYRRELDFYRTAGPVEWQQDKDGLYQWQWRQPPNTFWDERRKVYIQEQKGVDPNLELKEMRQHMLDITRMGSMVKVGRVNYFRTVVVVGNGRGVYGFGVGFGNSAKEARADGSLKALQNLDYIDLDQGQMLTTPTKGMEYKHSCTIIPRPIGRGIRANKKFLPLLYILGLNNCKVKFMHGKWFTRIRAIKRALDMIVSRRTLANQTGKRYALLTAPGDHWVHWPDRWFDVIRDPYDKKAAWVKLVRRHALHFKKRGNTVASERELRPGWRSERWARWNSPLDRWLQSRRQPLERPKEPDTALPPASGA